MPKNKLVITLIMFLAASLKSIKAIKSVFYHVFSLKGCAHNSSAWKLDLKRGAASFSQSLALAFLLITLLLLVSLLVSAQGRIVLDKEVYGLDETVTIRLENASNEYSLSIASSDNVYKYSGELKEKVEFYAKEPGAYQVILSDDGRNIIDEKEFLVLINPVVGDGSSVYTNKKNYALGETVLVFINATGDYELIITYEKEVFKYLDTIISPLPFIPQSEGTYNVELRKSSVTVVLAEFSVGEDYLAEQDAGLESVSEPSLPFTGPELIEPLANESFGTGVLTKEEEYEYGYGEDYGEEDYMDDEELSEMSDEETSPSQSISLPFPITLRDAKQMMSSPLMRVVKAEGIEEEYDVELFPGKAGVISLKLKRIRMSSAKEIGFDEITLNPEEARKSFNQKNVIKSFFIDPSGLNFTNGTITAIAAGRELWKCKEWSAALQACLGSWQKVMDLTPGEEYQIAIFPGDPAYAETGVASINTKKPIYHPNETAEIIIVVLDTKGHLVSNADVELIITAPDNAITILKTSTGEITETSRGIYEAIFTGTTSEGSYDLFVSARGMNVNSIMQSSFEVREFYEFDILRNTPVTTDPWQGPFASEIRLLSYINISEFSYTEVLPSDFEVADAGGAEQRIIDNKIFLTWSSLINNSVVKYFAQPPLITPNLYELGKSFITYTEGAIKVFTESRLWQLAIDPLIGLFFEDFESGWGCRKTTAPAAGDNCGRTPWGSFTNCNVSSTARFCTTDDGQEGNHVTYAIQMTYWGTWNETQGLWYWFDPSPYDDINVNGYQASASLDNNNEFCRVWARDSDSWATIYQCVNNVPAGCEAGDTTPEQADYRYFNVNLSSLSGINLSETNLSVHIGAQLSATNDYCFFDRINITGITSPPNITNLTYPGNNTLITVPTFNFNFTVNATKDTKLPNCTLYANFTGSWQANTTIYNVTKNTETNITLSPADGTYKWNVICYTKAGLYDWYDYNYTVTIDARPPVKTIINIDDDTSPPWETTNRNPFINISLNKNGNCRMSLSDETYANMSDDYDCTGDGTTIINCTYTGAQLPIGTNYIYVACNDTSGHADNTITNLDITLEVLCDSHADCADDYYCDFTQQCHQDEIPGYPCDTHAYAGLEWDEVCGDGSNRYCVNDSSYSYTGWYCTASATDCVYNDQGKSYSFGETLCESGSNDYRNCSSSNMWGALFDCAEQYDPYNQSATYHAGEYCAYYATAQSCVNGTSGGCSGPPANCNPYIYNQTEQECGSVLAQCDLGCGAGCDPSNSTTPELISGACYYDKSCTNACSWSQSSEEAPDYCINDNDGGACAYSTRTNPANDETCYWSVDCQDGSGASLTLGTANNLRADYCDYCNASGNQSGQYSPAPNASCSSGCADSGTIYYDAGGTPLDRNDDCSNGITTIMSDTLSIGDVWNSSAPAYCDDTECDNDCGTLVGACNLGVCECTDNDNPELIIISPAPDAWDNDGIIIFTYSVLDVSSGIMNCSLIINGSINMTNATINESLPEQSFTQGFANGTYNWSIRCYDNSIQCNSNQSEARTIGVDTVPPSISNPSASGNSYSINQQVCLNVSASDTISGIGRVYARIQLPDLSYEEVELYDSSTTSCDSTNGNGIYSAEYTLIFDGEYNWGYAYATDMASNTNNASATKSWNVTAGGNINLNMTAPSSNITINESEANNYFNQNCSVTCQNNGTNCKNVLLFPQYYTYGGWEKMNFSTALFPDALNYSCGNLSPQGSASWWNSSWAYRKKISIINNNNTNSLPANYSLRISVNTIGSTMLDNGNDVRIAYWNGTNNTEIDRINTTAFNSSNTEIWFKIQKDISPGTKDTNYYLYYGNPGAGSAPQNKTHIYDFWDDFSGGLSQWTVDSENTDTVSVNSTAGNPAPSLRHDPDSTQTKNAYYDTRLQTTDYRFQNGIIEYDIYLSGTARSIHQFGFRAPNLNFTNGYAWRLQSSSGDGGWMEFTGRASWATFGTAYPATTTGTWHHVILNISGANYNATVDGGSIYSGTDSTKLSADYLISHVHATGTDYYVLIDNIQARKTMSPAPSASLQEEESPPVNNASCSHTFNITAQPNSGNSILGIRCMASSSNSATVFSDSINVTINDHPIAMINYPENGTWITGTININASLSYDSDGTITNYLFEYDNNTAFNSPSTICNGASSNCTFNTASQDQCENNSMSCYLRVTVTDNGGLSNSTHILVGFDTQGPSTTIDKPASFSNITTTAYKINATAIDNEIGIISIVFFEFRENSTAEWKPICNDTEGEEYNCTWDTTTLSDGTTYEVRAYAIDTLNNTGSSDARTNITIDRNGPVINLESPDNDSFNKGNETFWFNVSDSASQVQGCDFIINGKINQSMSSPEQGVSLGFSLNNTPEGSYSWSINCTDILGNIGASETRIFTVDLTGPTTTIDRPVRNGQVFGLYKVNATATDPGVGNISIVFFEFRENSTAEWKPICNDTEGEEYNCTWDTTTLSDGTTYEVRAYAIDTLNNTGTPHIREGLTLDNQGPVFDYLWPQEGFLDTDGNITFAFRVHDEASGITNCSLYINGSWNQTNTNIVEGETTYFYLYNLNDTTFNWSIECWDNFTPEMHRSESEARNMIVMILYVLNANITTDKSQYEKGNQEADTANITTSTLDYANESIEASAITDIILSNESRNTWWNTTWKYRIRSTLEETVGVTRKSQWAHLSFMLDENCENLAHRNSLRLLQDEANNQGARSELEFNQWNITYCPDNNYVKSLWVSFRLNLTANQSANIYIYFDNKTAFSQKAIDRGPMRIVWVSTGGSGNAPAAATIRTDLNAALSALSLSAASFYNEISTSAASSDLTFNNISNYSIIYYDSGAKYGDSWTSAEANALFQYINQSGNLFLTGQDLGYDANSDGWIYNAAFTNLTRVSAGWVDNANPTTFTVMASHPTTQYIGSVGTTVSVTGDYEDGYTTLAGTTTVQILNWTGSSTPRSGTANNGLTDPSCTGFCGKTVYYSGIFYISSTQGIQNTNARSAFLQGSIEWFLDNELTEAKGRIEKWVARNSTESTGTSGKWSWLWSVADITNGTYTAVSQASKTKYNNATAWTTFNITIDSTPPNITLNSPPDGSEANSSVTFTYYVNDTLSTVSNCSLIIDGVVDGVDYTIQEGPIQYFYPRIPAGGWHNWSVNCTDYYGNIGASEKWEIFIRPPDLVINSSNIIISNPSPKEGENITINATIENLGGSDAQNVIMQIFLGDPDSGGTQLGENFTANITEITGSQPNFTISTTWVAPEPGPFEFYIVVDPPTLTNGSIFELNESNNKAYNTINVPAYNYFYGKIENNIYLGSASNDSFYYYLGIENVTGYIYAAHPDSAIGFSSLQAIGRDIYNNTASNDFNDTDAKLNMSSYNDSIRNVFTRSTDMPVAAKTMTVFNRVINDVPVVNSTNSSNFVTGMLWDMSDGGTDYSGIQDLLFVTEINKSKEGVYGIYDYEIKVPVNLRNYLSSGSKIVFYWEITESKS